MVAIHSNASHQGTPSAFRGWRRKAFTDRLPHRHLITSAAIQLLLHQLYQQPQPPLTTLPTIPAEEGSFTNTTTVLHHKIPTTPHHFPHLMPLLYSNSAGTKKIFAGNSHGCQQIPLLAFFVWIQNQLKYPSLALVSTSVTTFPY